MGISTSPKKAQEALEVAHELQKALAKVEEAGSGLDALRASLREALEEGAAREVFPSSFDLSEEAALAEELERQKAEKKKKP